MKLSKLLFASSCLVLWMTSFVLAQPAATIDVEHWSPWELEVAGRTTPPSTGLKVVGNGELVYLMGSGDEEVTAYTWSITSQPTGSTVVLDSTDKARTTFRPDSVGLYTIQLEIATATGNATTSIVITAAEYVGVGTVGGATPVSYPDGQCGLCHVSNTTSWMETGHATMFEEAIDGLKSSHYNESCIDCHTVGWDTTAVNGGFDDVQADLGWTFPDSLFVGNWADITTNFAPLATKSNIQCENCHGPGSLHLADKTKIDISLEAGTCGRCHEDGHYHRRNTMWKSSGHAIGTSFARGTSSSCAPCHSGWGFIAKIDPASDLDKKTGNQNISCAVCHDPHSGENGEHQIRDQDNVTLGDGSVITKGGKGKLCMNCHIGRREAITYAQDPHRHFGPHHSNQADMLFGANVITWGMIVPNSTHKDALENACVDCHMFATPAAGEPGRDLIGDHTWAMNTVVDSVVIENVAACVRCHGELEEYNDIVVTEDYDGDGTIEGYQDELDGQLAKVALLLPPLGDPDVQDDPDGNYSRIQLNALFNYHYIHDDGSHGAHNFRFAMGLMKLSEAALTYGVLAEGDVTSVMDVPNDQGKQVRVTWTRFGGDGISNNPVRNYAVWRKVEGGAASRKGTLNTLNVNSEDIAKLETGSRLDLEGDLWDFAGSVPASAMAEYSAIVPTLFDSTAAGLKLSTFKVSGHTNVTAIYAVTLPLSGYSIDNLMPMAPTNLAGQETTAGIDLTWDDSVDSDFNYFTLYRSTTVGFDPTGTEPIAKITDASYVDAGVAIGTKYYYRLSAHDFSGNESAFSSEFSLMVTSVEGNFPGVIPEAYSLAQNYPNPFNPTTNIQFGLKQPGHVTLTVYNALGEVAMEVMDGRLEAGFHQITLSASELTSGIYFYRLQINGFAAVRKMIVMK